MLWLLILLARKLVTSVVAAPTAVGIGSSLNMCTCLPSRHTLELKLVASVIE